MADEKLQIIIEAVDNVSNKLKEIESNISKTASNGAKDLVNLGAAIFVAKKAFDAVSDVIKDGIAAYAKQEEAINRLNFALKNQGTFTTALSRQYQDMAESLQKSTRFSDDAIEQLQQQLISVGNVAPQQMERVVRATLDFATATGTNLATAQDIMAKAAAGNTAMLGRYGIILDENIPKSAKFAAALGFIEKRFGGAAQEDIKSFAGQMEQLKNRWDDFLESVGKFVTKLGIVKVGIDAVSNALQFYGKVLDSLVGKQDEFSSDQTKFMKGQVDEINRSIKALETNNKLAGGQAEREQKINDLLIQRSRILDTIARLDKKSETDNATRNALIQEQQASDDAKKKLVTDAEEIAASFKAELDLLNQIELKFKDGQITEQEYYSALTGQKEEERQYYNEKSRVLTEIAELENFVNNKSLIEFTRINDAKKKVLQETKTQMLLSSEQIIQNAMSTLGRLGGALSQAASMNKSFARAAQGIAISQAIVNTAVAITRARSSAPPPLNYILAGIEAAAGAIQIATIASQSFAKGSANIQPLATGTDTVPAMLSPGEMVFPRSMADAIRAGDISVGGPGGGVGGGDINISLYGVTINSKENIRELAEDLGFEIDRKLRNARSNV